MSNNQIPSAAKDIFSAPGVYIEDVNMTMDFFTVDFPASAHMQAGVTPQCANYVPTNTAVSVAGNSQTAHNRITESCSHTAPVMQVKQVKAEVADSCSFPAGYNVNSVNTAVKYELGTAVPNNNDPYASLMTLFSPGQVDSIFNKLALGTEDFKCFRCSVKSNYDGAGNDLFNLKLAMCMNPSGGFCCPICDTKFRLPTPLEHHLNMHCLTGNGVSVRCVTCRDEFHVLIPGKKGETGDSLKKTTSLKQNNSIQEQSTSTDRNSSAESEDTQQWTKTSRGKNRKTKNLTDQSFVSLGYSKDCQVCGKHFGRHESLIVHMRTHTGEKPYVCQTCGKAFATSSHCRSHQAVHNANLRPQCKVCGKTLSRKEALKRHMRIHSGEKPYSCGQCDKKFRSHSDLRAHQIVHHGAAADKALACPVCGKNFNRKDTLTVHLRSHTGERPHGCDVCGKRFVTKSHLKSHQLTHSDIRDVPCPVCKKMFSRKETMKKHLQRHTDYHPFLCDTCGKAFFENKDLQEHLLTHGDKRWIHMCQMCGNAFTRRDSLAAHMQDHINEKLFKCDYCMKGFSKLQHLREHIRSTHRRNIKGKKFPCPVCSKLFLVKSHVNDHMKSHGNDKCFKCNTCGKYFIHQPHLVAHASVHMGTKRNQCRICGKAFRFWSNLKTHMCKHLGVRPYCCRYCTRTFIHKLKEHIRVHVGAKPYSCSVCAKDFHRKESRDYHMYKHTGVKPYLCEVCMKSFGNTHQMLRHKLVHKVKNTQFLSKILSGKKLRRVKRTRLMPPSEELTTVVSGQNAQNVVEVQLPVDASPVMVAGCNMVPSGQMMMFLHNQLQTALSSNLCSQDSGKSTTVQNIDQNKDIGEPVAMQKDHMLLTLTIVNNFIKSHIDDVTKTMREQNTASVLLGIMRNGDMFISRTASQCLISWLNECQQQDEWIPVVVDIITSLVNINTSYQGLVSSLDVLKRMFVEPKPGGPCAAGQIVEKRRLISSHLIAQCSALIHRFLHYTDRDQSSVLMYNLLSLWNKILKFHLKTSHLQNENEILYINHLLTESLCRGDVAPMCISKALASLNCCLPRSADFTTAYEMPKFHIELASRLMLSIECLLEMLPWVIGDEVFGCKLYRKYELQQCTDITVHLSTCALRKLVILTLKSVAVLVHAEFKAPGPGLVTVLSTLLSMVNKLQSVSHANKGRLGISLSWLFDCCGDQDDAMIDALLSLLHIILLLQKSCVVQLEVTHQLCSRFEPHLLFFVFIAAHASWDDSMLFDLLTSPETAILTYLVKYLHYVLQDWDRFVAACRHFSREYPLLLLSDTASSSSEAVGASSVATSCLEKTMTFLIRLRIKIERAQSRGLIAYNCEPLLKLFKQCEMLYER